MESENNDGSDFLGNNRFPEGMRVLVVDDNCVCLKTLVALLEKCRYKVTAATTAVEALKLLRENKDGFDVVITDVIMPEMDGFTLLELINLEIKDLPVILLSAFADKSNVMKGIESGAQVYLLKPPRFEEIKNIWQHVVRRNLSNATKSNKPTIQRDAALSNDEVPLPTQVGEGEEPNKESKCDKKSPSKKKRRVQWNERIHKKFVDAVFRLGVDRAVPKRILEIMNEPGLSRENIASHLQKYRKSRDNEKKNAYSSNSGVVNPQRASVSSSGNHRSRPELQGGVVAPMGHEMTQLGNQTCSSANHNNNNNNNNSFMSPNPNLVHPNPHLVHPNHHPDLLIQAQMQQGPYLAPDLDVPKMRSSGHADSTGIMPWMQQDYQNCNRSFRLQNQHGGEDIRKPVFSQTPSYGGSWEPGSSSVWPVGCGPGPVQLSGAGSELAGMRRFNAGPTCDSVVSIPNFSPVARNEGGSYFNINGGGRTGDVDYRGTINAYPLNMQGPAMETNPFQYGCNSFDPIALNNMDEEEISTLLDTLNSRM